MLQTAPGETIINETLHGDENKIVLYNQSYLACIFEITSWCKDLNVQSLMKQKSGENSRIVQVYRD